MYQAALGGTVDMVGAVAQTELMKAGKLRPLAVGGTTRSPMFPDLPTLAELGYSDQVFTPSYFGVAVGAGTPKEIVDRLAAALRTVVSDPLVIAPLSKGNVEASYMTPEETHNLVKKGGELYRPLIQQLKLDVN